MILFVAGAAIVYAALVTSSLTITTEDWWATHPTTKAAVLTLGLVPLLATWFAAELARFWRSPKVLTSNAGVAKRMFTGFIVGLVSCGTGTIAVVLLEPETGGLGWLLMGSCAFVSTSLLLAFAKPVRSGHCRRCDYNLAGVTPAAGGRCPECGLDLMAAA
jgi:hypothetical protein